MKKLNFSALLFNVIVALFVGTVLNIAAPVAIGAAIVAGQFAPNFSGIAGMAINKQIWTDVIMEGFYPKDDILVASVDMSSLVSFNTLNLAEAGADPAVLIDNTSYPVATAQRSDTPLTIALKTLDTENTVVRNLDEMETMYDKMDSVVRQHRNTLRKASVSLACHYWAPSADATFTPVIAATGDVFGGYKRLTFEDILTIRSKIVALDMDITRFNLCLNPKHEADLLFHDMKLYKDMIMTGKIWGIRYFVNSQTPRFNKSTGARVTYGAAPASSTDTIASTLWSSDEVMRADGTVEVFATYKDPKERGDIIGFQKRFVALPIRTKGLAAIYSPTS